MEVYTTCLSSMFITYQDTITLAKLKSSSYANKKAVDIQSHVKGIFIQNTDFTRFGFVESFDADAIAYVDPTDSFVLSFGYRLEGFGVNAPLFGQNEDQSWYKVESVEVNRDHLLTNQVDNVRLLLSKMITPEVPVS